MARSGTVRTRLTHSIEVSNYGELIAESLTEALIARRSLSSELRLPFVRTVENACLLHDIGNPPFGHMGEHAIGQWFSEEKRKSLREHSSELDRLGPEAERHLAPYAKFDGNPQGFRVITRLHWFTDELGMNLTCSLLAAYLKYLGAVADPTRRLYKKVGYFPTEEATVKDVWHVLGLLTDENGLPTQRHPLTYVMEAADDIAFCLSDIEDALEKGVVTEREFISWVQEKGGSDHLKAALRDADEIRAAPKADGRSLTENGTYHQFRLRLSRSLVECAVAAYVANEETILTATMEKSLLAVKSPASYEDAKKSLDLLTEFCWRNVYTSREAIETELGGLNAIKGLLNGYEPLMVLPRAKFDRLSKEDNRDRLKEDPILSLLICLLPKKHVEVYKRCTFLKPELEPIYRIQLVVDYVSGMTDSHVLKMYNILNGTQPFTIE